MSKRTHQDEQYDSDEHIDNPDPGGAGAQAPAELQQPNPAVQAIEAVIGAQGNPQATTQQDLIDIDNVIVTDNDQDTPEVRALKNYTRQMQLEKSSMQQSLVNQGRIIDNKKVDNARLLREKQKLSHDMDSIVKQMEKLKASSEPEVKQVIIPDITFTESVMIGKPSNPMDKAKKLISDHYEQQEKLKWKYETHINPTEQFEQTVHMDSDDETPRTRHSPSRLSESSILQALSVGQQNNSNSYPHPRRLTKSDSVEDLSTQTTYEVDDWKRVQMKTPQQDQLDNKEKLIKAEDKAITQQHLFLKILEKIQPPKSPSGAQSYQSTELDTLIHLAKKTITSQQAHLDKLSKEVKQTKQVATYYSHSLAKPTLYEFVDYNVKGTREALQAKNIKYVIDSFDPDKNPEQDFGAIWRKILMHTNNLRLDEAAFKDILTVIVQGSAAHVLFELIMEDKPLHQILQTFSDLYTKSKTIVDHMNDLNLFVRKSGETIVTAMRRARVMAERVRHLWPQALWENGKRLEVLTSILKQIIDQKTRKHLEYEEMKYLKTGTILEYKAILDIVETYETTNGLIPASSNPLTINVCTGVPNIIPQYEQDVQMGHYRPEQNRASRRDQELSFFAGEPMETNPGAYTPKFQFPPKSNSNLKENPIWKKARSNKSTERVTKSPSHDDNRPIRKAVRPSERSRSASFTRERPRDRGTSHRETPKVVPDNNREKAFTYQPRDARSQSRDRFEANRKSWNDYKGKANAKYNPNYSRNYSRDRSNDYSKKRYSDYSRDYSRSNSRDRDWNNRNQRSQKYPYKKKSFSSWRDNGEQKQHTRDWNKRDRTSMYQCKSCRTIHVLGSYCPSTGDQINESWQSTQALN